MHLCLAIGAGPQHLQNGSAPFVSQDRHHRRAQRSPYARSAEPSDIELRAGRRGSLGLGVRESALRPDDDQHARDSGDQFRQHARASGSDRRPPRESARDRSRACMRAGRQIQAAPVATSSVRPLCAPELCARRRQRSSLAARTSPAIVRSLCSGISVRTPSSLEFFDDVIHLRAFGNALRDVDPQRRARVARRRAFLRARALTRAPSTFEPRTKDLRGRVDDLDHVAACADAARARSCARRLPSIARVADRVPIAHEEAPRRHYSGRNASFTRSKKLFSSRRRRRRARTLRVIRADVCSAWSEPRRES